MYICTFNKLLGISSHAILQQEAQAAKIAAVTALSLFRRHHCQFLPGTSNFTIRDQVRGNGQNSLDQRNISKLLYNSFEMKCQMYTALWKIQPPDRHLIHLRRHVCQFF